MMSLYKVISWAYGLHSTTSENTPFTVIDTNPVNPAHGGNGYAIIISAMAIHLAHIMLPSGFFTEWAGTEPGPID